MGQEWSLGDLGGGGGGGIGDHPCPRLRMQGGQERWRKEEWEGATCAHARARARLPPTTAEPQAHLTPETALNQEEKPLPGLAEVQAVSCRRLVGWAASLGLPGWREEGMGLRVCTDTRSLGVEGRGSPHPNSSPRCETSYRCGENQDFWLCPAMA